MNRKLGVWVAMGVFLAGLASANGGPFVVKYPDGDPAAKGILARLGPDLKPTRETRLRVVEEDLTIAFGRDLWRERGGQTMPPLATVVAAYTIENPGTGGVSVDFGFPILRGIYVPPYEMLPRPDVEVRLDEDYVRSQVITNSAIYGIIRASARRAIERGLASTPRLPELVRAVRSASEADREAAREALRSFVTHQLQWDQRDATLLVEYASLELGPAVRYPRDRGWGWTDDRELNAVIERNLGPLAAIGEQKATQFLAHLASRFEPETAAGYEAIFAAWGGDVRERSVDLATGEVRPREISIDPADIPALEREGYLDPTIYARVEYFDESAQLPEALAASCRAILKNLPVIFTFAPMNLIHYQPTLTPGQHLLTVSYSQYAYRDTRSPASYQLAYVVHPASMWDEFGPINLEVLVPEGVPFRASVPCEKVGTEERGEPGGQPRPVEGAKARFDVYRGNVTNKTGELLVAVDAASWNALSGAQNLTAQRLQAHQARP